MPVFIKDISSYLYRPKVDLLFIDSVLAINIYMRISEHWLEEKKTKKPSNWEHFSVSPQLSQNLASRFFLFQNEIFIINQFLESLAWTILHTKPWIKNYESSGGGDS